LDRTRPWSRGNTLLDFLPRGTAGFSRHGRGISRSSFGSAVGPLFPSTDDRIAGTNSLTFRNGRAGWISSQRLCTSFRCPLVGNEFPLDDNDPCPPSSAIAHGDTRGAYSMLGPFAPSGGTSPSNTSDDRPPAKALARPDVAYRQILTRVNVPPHRELAYRAHRSTVRR